MIAFAGDSLLCAFLPENDEGSMVIECCNRVIQCGLKLSKFHIDETTIHVGISFGSLSFALLGGYNNRYSLLMNGRCVDEIGVCLDHACSEEVVVTRELIEQAGLSDYNFTNIGEFELPLKLVHTLNDFDNPNEFSHLVECFKIHSKKKIRILTGLSHQITPSLHEDESLHFIIRPIHYEIFNNCVPSPVVSAAISGTLTHLSEIRTITTLFLRLDSYSTSKFTPLTFLQPFFLSMQKCLFECGGMLRQFLIDDKGCVLIGLWGVPTANHPNNCCMAVRCSVMMQNAAKLQGEIISIGITTGSVYTGLVGPEQRRDYVAIGNSVNLSARLMSKASNRILLDTTTCQKLPLSIRNSLHRINGLELKGVCNNIYYQFDSIIPPSERLRDIREDRMIVIEDYIRKKRDEILTTLDLLVTKDKNGLPSSSLPSFSLSSSSSPSLLSNEQQEMKSTFFDSSDSVSEDSINSETKKKNNNNNTISNNNNDNNNSKIAYSNSINKLYPRANLLSLSDVFK